MLLYNTIYNYRMNIDNMIHTHKDKYFRDSRECQITNYIPNVTNSLISHYEWHTIYISQISNIYNIIIRIIDQRYPYNGIQWNNPKFIDELSKILFKCSTKHISKYL